MTPEEKLLKIVEDARGDNLERAQEAFAGKDLNQEHGLSGETRQEILDGYKRERAEWQAAYGLAKAQKQSIICDPCPRNVSSSHIVDT